MTDFAPSGYYDVHALRTAVVSNDSTGNTSTAKVSAGTHPTGKRPAAADGLPYGFDRLEAAVNALADRCDSLQVENAELYRKLNDLDTRLKAREAELIDANQVRQEVGKRIDELIAQIDLLDGQLEGGES